MTTTNDEELLQRIAAERDREAFQALFDRFGTKAFSLALYLSGNRAKAEEAVQDAMLSVWLKAGRFEPSRGTAKAWVLRIVANKAIQSERKEQSERNREMIVREDASQAEAAAPEAEVTKEALLDALREKFAELPDAFRQVLALYFAAEMSQEEISMTLDIPQSTISMRIRQGLDDLRRRLKGAGYAAALPLVASNGFGEVLLSGTKVPAGLGARILESLGSAAEHSVRVAAASKGAAGVWVALGVFTAAVAVGGWRVVQGGADSGTGARVQVAASKSEPPAPAPRPLQSKTWTFENGIPRDLILLEGAWELRKSASSGEQVLYLPQTLADQPGLMVLPVPVGSGPFVLEVKEAVQDFGQNAFSLAITDGRTIREGRSWSRPPRALTMPEIPSNLQFQYQYWYSNRYIGCFEQDYVFSIQQFDADLAPSTRMVLAVYKLAIKAITFRQVGENEVPELVRNADREIAAMEKEGIQAKGPTVFALLERHIRALEQAPDPNP